MAWYCNRECQQCDSATHKPPCHKTQASVKSLATKLRASRPALRLGDTHYYFGNTIAKDFLQLDNNEWSVMGKVEEELAKDYHVLSAGCGDLRNTVLTAGSLPARYQGKLHFTLNDFDAFVMARNVLFLYMLVRFADTEGIESSLSTIWYSVHISKREYDLIKTSLDELIQLSAKSLRDVTKGLVSVSDEGLMYLCQVWAGWKALECQRDKRTSVNLRKQRVDSLRSGRVKRGQSIYLDRLSPGDNHSMEEWFDHGLFVPSEMRETDVPFDNPTLTGVKAPASVKRRAPKDCMLFYSIGVDSFPFVAWDSLRVRESSSRSCSSPMVMYHNYVTNLLQKVKSLILQGRLYVHISLANCLDFPYHLSLQMPNYDRIFTSNLADYVGFAKLLRTFKPLLNRSNIFSVIVTETMNWFKLTPGADFEFLQSTQEFQKCCAAYCLDTARPVHDLLLTFDIGFNSLREYYNNTSCFLVYLRADIMGGGLGVRPLQDVPWLKTVMKYHGMRMRDFCKERNRLVPFQYRVNARDLNMMIGCERAVEWCLSQTDG